MNQLRDYHKKRNFKITSEPAGSEDKTGGEPVFVIQQHDAKNLHFDFRIAHDGVLLSWAVPKGPSVDKSVKRLAIRTEDHPLEYADFEGIIPDGEYGAGIIIVWDHGKYRNLTRKDGKPVDLGKAIKNGHFNIWLEGKKIQGGFSMTRIKDDRNNDQWLMSKLDDEKADARRNPVATEPESVISGKDLDDYRKELK